MKFEAVFWDSEVRRFEHESSRRSSCLPNLVQLCNLYTVYRPRTTRHELASRLQHAEVACQPFRHVSLKWAAQFWREPTGNLIAG